MFLRTFNFSRHVRKNQGHHLSMFTMLEEGKHQSYVWKLMDQIKIKVKLKDENKI